MTRATFADGLLVVTYLAGFGVAAMAAAEDLRSHRLPNTHTAAVAIIAALGLTLSAAVAGEGLALGDLVLGVALFSGPWLVIHLIQPRGLGFGDVKLTAGLGLYLGWLDPALALFAVIAATVGHGLGMLATRSTFAEPKPFGPALVGGAATAIVAAVALGT